MDRQFQKLVLKCFVLVIDRLSPIRKFEDKWNELKVEIRSFIEDLEIAQASEAKWIQGIHKLQRAVNDHEKTS